MNKCLECQVETNNPKFCSSSCAAKFHNRNRVDKCPNKNGTKICKCIKCEREVEVNIRHNPNVVKCEVCKNKCFYCKLPAKFKLKNGRFCCSDSSNKCRTIREKNSNGLKQSYIEGIRQLAGVGTKGFFNGRNLTHDSFISLYDVSNPLCDEDFKLLPKGSLKKILIKERGWKCERCENTLWNGVPITLELEHNNGTSLDNSRENLKLLCPNCHSQTSTWRRRKDKNNNRLKYDVDVYIDAIVTSYNMNQCLNELGLKWGSNSSVKSIMKKYNLEFKAH